MLLSPLWATSTPKLRHIPVLGFSPLSLEHPEPAPSKEQRELPGRTCKPLSLSRSPGFLQKSVSPPEAQLEGQPICEAAPFPILGLQASSVGSQSTLCTLWIPLQTFPPACLSWLKLLGGCTLPDSPLSPIYRARRVSNTQQCGSK